MVVSPLDWSIIGFFFVFYLLVGIVLTRRAGKSTAEFFAAGRSMPWWLLGISMVATTFSTDVPNLVTNIVREDGVMGNWIWWAFLPTGMLTVFVYARLWRRSGVLTDLEFYELRYSGKSAAFLRGFRAIYLGIFFNVIVMASVSLAAIKIGSVLLGLTPIQTILIASVVTVIYSSTGGLRGVLVTDLIQFSVAMIGAVAAAIIALRHPDVGGLSKMLTAPTLQGKLALFPSFTDPDQRGVLVTVFLMPIIVQWWSVWYPGSEPGGGSYVAQRMLAAKDEKNAAGAVFLFNAAHYALRPWPWIIVALCSLLVFPTLDSLKEAFPHAANVIGHDMGYSAMLTFLPAGLLGLVIASLIAAYMSTISTHLNWGASYAVHDFYSRFLRPEASEKELVLVARVVTVVLMVLAGGVTMLMETARDNFQIILMVGAGTGLIFILRWFWWRINAASEIAAMVISFIVAVYFRFLHHRFGFAPLSDTMQLLLTVGITTAGWLLVTFVTRPVDKEVLQRFCSLIRPGGPGWKEFSPKPEDGMAGDKAWQVPLGILCMLLGCLSIYSTLFATGYIIYGSYRLGIVLTVVAVLSAVALVYQWRKLLQDD